MAYATQADIETLYGADALVVADRDGDGEVDTAAVARALDAASAEIDTYLAVRYPLPLASVPPMLRQWCVDIAVYRLALAADVRSDEHRTRYEDALAALKRVADGKSALVFSSDPEAPAAPVSPRPIVAGGPPRLFSRDTLRDL